MASALCPAVLMQSSADRSALGRGLLADLDAVSGAALVLRRRAPLAVFLVVTCALVTVVVIGGAIVVAAGTWTNHLTAAPEYRGGSDVLATLPLAWALGDAARTHHVNLAAAARRADAMSRERELREQQAASRRGCGPPERRTSGRVLPHPARGACGDPARPWR